MKLLTASLLFSLLFLQNLKSQDSLQMKKNKPQPPVYSIKLILPGSQTFEAHLMNIKDSSIYVYTKSKAKQRPSHKINKNDPSNWESYHYKFVTGIKMRNNGLRSWLMPTTIVAGIIGGALIGKNAGSGGSGWNGAGNAAGSIFLGGVLGCAAGAITGAVICSASEKKYMINGDWKSFEELKADLKY